MVREGLLLVSYDFNKFVPEIKASEQSGDCSADRKSAVGGEYSERRVYPAVRHIVARRIPR